MNKNYYTTFDIARFCEVSILAVVKWINQGKLIAHKTPGGHRRVKHEDLLLFLNHYQMPVPSSLQGSQKKKVLVVDDDPAIIKMVRKILKKSNLDLEIETALDGYEAGEKVVGFLPDLVILDLQLPGVDGLKICRNIKKHKGKEIKVVVITGNETSQAKQNALESGADCFIFKSSGLGTLSVEVAQLLNISFPRENSSHAR